MQGLKLNKKSNYILACNYSSESMALLHMLLKEDCKPIVCYVNYHKEGNNSANRLKLSEFCKEKDLILEARETSREESNQLDIDNPRFRDWARTERYNFFKTVYEKYQASGLFLTHTQDDLLEDYLLKSNHDKDRTGYSWNIISEQDGMIIIRPLLNYSDNDLHEYCIDNHVPFCADTNVFEDRFVKNPIRFNVINKLTEIERENLILKFKGEEAEKMEFVEGLKRKIDTGEEIDVRELIALDSNSFADTLSNMIASFDETIQVTPKLLSEIRSMCLNPEENLSVRLSDKLWITKEYDVLSIGGNLLSPLYSYQLAKPGKLKTEYFEMDFSNGAQDRGFRLSDYPLTIRPAVPTDLFNVHGFMNPVRKLYYDWRMPAKKKVIWPVIANKYGEIIYIPRYHRLHRTDYTSTFEIKFSQDD